MARRFQFSLRALIHATAAVALLFAFFRLGAHAKLAYVNLVFDSATVLLKASTFLVLLALFFPHACHFARQMLGQCPPPDDWTDAEPIRFDLPPPSDSE